MSLGTEIVCNSECLQFSVTIKFDKILYFYFDDDEEIGDSYLKIFRLK